ncbi:hypothetical protein CNMCM5793_008765 [Aspergillus hiratsukae]|uniref:Photolyase/cryptochrome alpha/beta domain-containing protein n=1 Tax=Aspergillus hiratsukae TaxID=1194566 RepID=A0A8H6PPX2_9EURO|nr:hypothetical protein CNMCM5793_008765 [Aspergillus hiratsukae]KAF7157969.1 hypothetical protein CNMCM6106_004258 [Aspergillus hiratsukae]
MIAPTRDRPDLSRPHPNAQQSEDFGIVLREFYPPEMSNERCVAYSDGTLERPIETLQRAYEETADQRRAIRANSVVVHWFKSDLRLHDNRALQMAYQAAKEHNIPLLGLYILSPQDLTAHLLSPARRIVDLCQQWGANHLYANLEYEVDELRREAKLVRLCAKNGIKFETAHDACVVPPGQVASQQGRQYAVYSPWYRVWLAYLKKNPDCLELSEELGLNPGDARKQFKELSDSEVPAALENKQLSEEKKHLGRLYPAGEHEALRRLEAFLEEKVKDYAEARNMVCGQTTSILRPYFASGLLSARTAVEYARRANKGSLQHGDPGLVGWISEVVWREFYKHVLVHWPFICMNKCLKPEFTNLEWEYDEDKFNAWCEGKTGFPIVDAAMRQIKQDKWMHNRTRMVVASFLSKDLLIDWRRGERYVLHGESHRRGFCVQPWRSERFDPDGEYIGKWVPELREIKGQSLRNIAESKMARKNLGS